tara:strand:- start:255 stop:431 length:177 start_codon:yes stop_codon:yes gene_type:complete
MSEQPDPREFIFNFLLFAFAALAAINALTKIGVHPIGATLIVLIGSYVAWYLLIRPWA